MHASIHPSIWFSLYFTWKPSRGAQFFIQWKPQILSAEFMSIFIDIKMQTFNSIQLSIFFVQLSKHIFAFLADKYFCKSVHWFISETCIVTFYMYSIFEFSPHFGLSFHCFFFGLHVWRQRSKNSWSTFGRTAGQWITGIRSREKSPLGHLVRPLHSAVLLIQHTYQPLNLTFFWHLFLINNTKVIM